MTCCVLPLWSSFSGVVHVPSYESTINNAEEGCMFGKIMLFAMHPQRMFYEWETCSVAVRQDLASEAASYVVD